MDSVQSFYDDLAESYHLIFEDWNRSIERQGDPLTRVLEQRWGLRGGRLLDVAAALRPSGSPPVASTSSPRTCRRAPSVALNWRQREWKGRRVFAEQEWHWHGATYEVRLRIRPVDDDLAAVVEVQTTYLAVQAGAILELMRDIGLAAVERLDGAFYQPLLIGTVPRAG